MILTVNFLNGILIPIQIIRMINFDQVFITFLKRLSALYSGEEHFSSDNRLLFCHGKIAYPLIESFGGAAPHTGAGEKRICAAGGE